MKKEILKSIKEDRLYDYIASNYYQLSKEELKDIILELDYRLSEVRLYQNERFANNDYLIEDLENRWEYVL